MNRKLLLNPEVEEIARAFFKSIEGEGRSFEDGWGKFLAEELGEIRQNEKRKNEEIEYLALSMQEAVPNKKVLPSNKNLRSNTKNIVNKLKTFKNGWKDKRYTPEVILAATKMYGEEVTNHPERWFSPLNFFIIKDNASTLAEYCDKFLAGEEAFDQATYKSNVI